MERKKFTISELKNPRVKTYYNGKPDLLFSDGKFDSYCIYALDPETSKYMAPLDKSYFKSLILFSKKYSKEKLYNIFLKIYSMAEEDENKIEDYIKCFDFCSCFGEDSYIIGKIMCILYMGMIAENNKKNAILKKRIKHLGIYQILFLNFSAKDAANFSKGKNWKEIDDICRKYNI